MNTGYASLIQELFPQAEIIIDRFHIVQLINRSMNKCRIQVMNQLSKSNAEDQKKYRRLKRYWKLFLKSRKKVSTFEYKYYPLFGQRTEAGMIDEMLEYSSVLKANYEQYQLLIQAITNQNINKLIDVLTQPILPAISSYMRTSMKTLKKHLPFIQNSFRYPYNNGRIEGINNKIKVLNRVTYGYRNFSNYKSKRQILHTF